MANKILIVDDEPFNLDLLEQELMDYDYRLERAATASKALGKNRKLKAGCDLARLHDARMNGLEVVKQLRGNPEHKGIPVILLTAKATQEDKVAGLDAGGDDYVTKPFDSFELLARVRAMMRLKEMHDTLEEWNRTLADTVKNKWPTSSAWPPPQALSFAADRRNDPWRKKPICLDPPQRNYHCLSRPARLYRIFR